MGGVSTRNSTHYPPRDTGGVLVITVRIQCRTYGPIKKGELASSWNSLLAERMYELVVSIVPYGTGTVRCYNENSISYFLVRVPYISTSTHYAFKNTVRYGTGTVPDTLHLVA